MFVLPSKLDLSPGQGEPARVPDISRRVMYGVAGNVQPYTSRNITVPVKARRLQKLERVVRVHPLRGRGDPLSLIS